MKRILYITAVLAALAGCTKSNPGAESSDEMQFIPAMPGTKATDNAFEDGDKIGVFAVAYENGKPAPLQISGNWATNAEATLNGSKWTVSPTVWWKKEDVKYDIYAYYPFDSEMESVDDYEFEVLQDQRDKGFTKSDLMWTKTLGISRTETGVPLNFKHKLSRIDINLIKGEDYEGELPATAEVRVLNTVTSAILDLESGDVQKDPYGTEKTILAKKTGLGKYSAIVVPQKLLNQVPILEIIANDVSYLVNWRFVFESGVRHTIDVTLSSDPNKVVINIGGKIEGWI